MQCFKEALLTSRISKQGNGLNVLDALHPMESTKDGHQGSRESIFRRMRVIHAVDCEAMSAKESNGVQQNGAVGNNKSTTMDVHEDTVYNGICRDKHMAKFFLHCSIHLSANLFHALHNRDPILRIICSIREPFLLLIPRPEGIHLPTNKTDNDRCDKNENLESNPLDQVGSPFGNSHFIFFVGNLVA